MSFYRRINYFLVHTLKLTNKNAKLLITSGAIKINGISIYENCFITENEEITVNDVIERPKKEFVYLKFNKPSGYESTLNKKIDKNISIFFEGYEDITIAGRLDKQSQGLLLLSNNGKWVENLCNPKFEKEKEYLVTLDKSITNTFIHNFTDGVEIDGYVTKKCVCIQISATSIKVILREGKNRQIRKMCLVLGYKVLVLKRIRIADFLLENLEEGCYETISILAYQHNYTKLD